MRKKLPCFFPERYFHETLDQWLKRVGRTEYEHLKMKQRYWFEQYKKRRKKLEDHIHFCRPFYHQAKFEEHYWVHKDSPLCHYADDSALWSNLYKRCKEHEYVKKYPRPVKFPRLPKHPRL